MTAESVPTDDYYADRFIHRPKQEIGEYVASNGHPVPLIDYQTEWMAALEDGSAMCRSEMSQDYAGLQGIISSLHITNEESFDPFLDAAFDVLRNNERYSEEYLMHHHLWPADQARFYREAGSIGYDYSAVMRDIDIPQSSRWRYVDGLNVRLFKDPHVDGRYHYATRSEGNWPDGYYTKSSGYVERDQYDTELQDYTYPQPLIAEQAIELYESVRALDRFDVTNAPLMEMQLAKDGVLHFLQYYKTRHSVMPTDEFDLPKGVPTFDRVRGVTPPEGREARLYIEPRRITPQLIGQACLVDMLTSKTDLQQDLLGRSVDMFVSLGLNSLAGNHWSASPLYAPEIYVSAEYGNKEATQKLSQLVRDIAKRPRDTNYYVDMRLTANGRDASIDTDYVLHRD